MHHTPNIFTETFLSTSSIRESFGHRLSLSVVSSNNETFKISKNPERI